MPFDAGVIAEIQAKVDLLAYVSQYVTLKKRGREYVGLCPFHSEKTPSFYLNADKQVWHCYGCDAGGDLIKFVQRYENVDFPAALRMLAGRAGVELKESAGLARRRSEREAIYEANAAAAAHFASQLRKHRDVLGYLKTRGIAPQSAETFGIGFAPDAWDSLAGALERAKIDLEIAARAGLIRARPQGNGYYDFFRNRLMLPVYNLTGEVMAFGGRALGDEQPKYINTPNTSAYTKGQHVYALQLARRAAAADGTLVIVEGYLDAIALHQHGFGNAVASLGTAFTPEQARELRRVAANLYLCFDGDAAGQAATARSIDMLVDEGLNVRIVPLPEGRDPDEILLGGGAEAFAPLLAASQAWVDFKIELACRRIASKFASKSDVAREAMAVIERVRDPIERDQYVKIMAQRLEVSEEGLRRSRFEFSRRPHEGGRSLKGERYSQTAEQLDRPIVRRAPPTAQPLTLERELLKLVLARPALLPAAASRVSSEDFLEPAMRDAYARLVEHRETIASGLNPLSLFAEQEIAAELTRLALASPPLTLEEDERRLGLTLTRFERRRLERRLSIVDEEVNRLLTAGQPVPEPLRDEYNTLATSLRGAAENNERPRENT